MEIEKILSTIKEKLGTTNLSERTLKGYLDKNLPVDGTEPDDAYFEKHTEVLKLLDGQFNHDIAKKVDDLKKNFKTKTKEDDDDDDNKSNEVIASLKKEIEDLKADFVKANNERTISELRNNLVKEMKKQGATDDYVLNNVVKGLSINPEVSFDVMVTNALQVYDKELTDCRGAGVAPRNAGGVDGKKTGEDFINSLKASYIAEGKLPKND